VDEHEKERDKSEVEVAASQEPDLKEAGLEEAAIDTR
jgi:hypothetical protein